MTRPVPEYELDIFTPEAVRDARAVDDALREFAPVVRLADGTHMLGRHEHIVLVNPHLVRQRRSEHVGQHSLRFGHRPVVAVPQIEGFGTLGVR